MQSAKPAKREGGRRSSTARRAPPAAATAGPRLARGVLLFDRYRLERELGRGGVADVWQAHDERLDRSVAVKVLHPDLLPDEAWRRRFIAEARAASGLSHPGIVPVYDVLDDPETPAIVFQLVDGESLATRLARDGEIPLEIATAVAAQVAGALDHAHRSGLVHRDVKPANIVIDREGRARLVDFGIARVVDDASAEREGREVVGTLRYMAPEQLAGRPTDVRTDLYALGLVIAEMLPRLDAGPEWLRELVARLRAPDPVDRPSSAADVARALETGRLDADPAPSLAGGIGPAGIGAAPAIDPDAVTRSFGDPDEAEDPERQEPQQPAERLAVSARKATPTGAGAPVATVAVAAPAIGPAKAERARRVRTDKRPVVVAVLVTAIALAGFAISRGELFGAASGAGPTVAPAASTHPTSTPAQAPVGGGGAPPPKPHKGHGHGRG